MKKLLPPALRSAIKRKLRDRSVHLSQAGQDRWVFGEVFDEKRNGYFVDIGAHDGVELSNSYLLEKNYEWQGICIEANPDSFAKLKRDRTAICVNVCLDEKPGTVQFSKNGMHGGIVGATDEELGEIVTLQAMTLDQVLEQHKAPQNIDYLSVDVEGAEDRVFAGFDLTKRNVTCLTVERPSQHLRGLLSSHGFMLIKEIPGLDCFYLHESHKDQYLQSVLSFHKKLHITKRWK
jgi:FkbM family methyltransferase